MPLEPLFHVFRPLVAARFAAAKADAGPAAAFVALQIEETPLGRGNGRAEFMVIDPAGPVRVTWNGVGSLWAFCQGAARLGRRMFDRKRNNQRHLNVDDDPELQRGLNILELARRLCSQDIPAFAATAALWPAWAPPLDPAPPSGTDDETGNRFFVGALDWILRHEVAHMAMGHAERQQNEGLTNRECESEADLAATRWLKGARAADPERAAGSKPSATELQLEWGALSNGIGLIWVALLESERPPANGEYPPVAERILSCLDTLGLREDSCAGAILSDIIQVWIGPEENWTPGGGHPTAHDAVVDALLRVRPETS